MILTTSEFNGNAMPRLSILLLMSAIMLSGCAQQQVVAAPAAQVAEPPQAESSQKPA